MSRHSLAPRPDVPGVYEAAIGWDRPLGSFFVIVFGPPGVDGELEVIEWRGTLPSEIEQPAAAIAVAQTYAVVPDDLAVTLQLDRIKAPAAGDGIVQRQAKLLIHQRRQPPPLPET